MLTSLAFLGSFVRSLFLSRGRVRPVVPFDGLIVSAESRQYHVVGASNVFLLHSSSGVRTGRSKGRSDDEWLRPYS